MQESCEELEKCLDSKLIDWTREPVFVGLYVKHENILKQRILSKDMKIVSECPAVYARIPKEQVKQNVL